MAELTNLTDRISHLRERKGSSATGFGSKRKVPRPTEKSSRSSERRFANDYFMIFVYGLLAIALIFQFGLILWLDIV